MKKTPSIKRNYLFNLAVTVINVGYPIVSFAYIARIFGPQVYGSVVFAGSLAAYFALVACLGLPVYGSREIARVRDDSHRLDILYSELLLINALSSAFFFLCYLGLFFFVHKIQEDVPLFALFGLSIILNAFSIDWLFQGLENYAIIALRNFIFRSLSLILIFVLIHKKSDYLQFAAISVISTLGTNVMNVIASRKHVRLSFSGLDVRRHVRPLLAIAGTVVMVSVYSNFDNVLLGFLSDDTHVGYYGAAARIVRIVVYCITAIGAVVIPRYSYYIEKRMHEEYDILAKNRSGLCTCWPALQWWGFLSSHPPSFMSWQEANLTTRFRRCGSLFRLSSSSAFQIISDGRCSFRGAKSGFCFLRHHARPLLT